MTVTENTLPTFGWAWKLAIWVVTCWVHSTESCVAGLAISEPLDYQVIQRHSRTDGTLRIRGTLDHERSADATLEVRFFSGDSASEWSSLVVTREGKQFEGSLGCKAGGWYRLEMRAVVGDATIAESSVEHVGIGEVFVVTGQSNSANHGEVRQSTRTNRVATLADKRWQIANDPQPGASGNQGSFLPPFGDEMVRRFDVPVGFVACGIGATSVREWLPKGATFPNPPTIESRVQRQSDTVWESKGDAYSMLVSRMKQMGPFGFRAVLWHQGESDANQKDSSRTLPGNLYREYLESVIRRSRDAIGWDAPWFVAQVSYHVPGDESSPDIREAQASLWKDGIALQGPDSDALKGEMRERGGKGVHFSDLGLREHASRWADKVSPWLENQFKSNSKTISFNRDMRPILSSSCFACHGPDSNTRAAGLRLDDAESAQADRGGRVAIAAGKPDFSDAIRRILSEDPETRMPPPDSGHQLTPEQKDTFRKWIEQGAIYEKHWAFHPVVRPQVPKTIHANHPIDSFVQGRLKEIHLEASELASPETQVRRVSLDLTGLPPTLGELDDFSVAVNLNGLEQAFEAFVDRLLKSPRYAERMAWPWMEAARYADTDGYQNDGHRDMWRWRDWVIDALHHGMPFDQFTIEQLAGDLLPDPTHEQLIATAFNRNNRYNSEEGIPIDEFLLENAIDRVDTTATVWMGLTAGCARCHDHKFDPISQKEYYQLVDYFNDVAESGRAVKVGNSEPWIKTPVEEQKVKLSAFDTRVKLAESRLEQADVLIAKGQSEWERSVSLAGPVLANGLDQYFSFDKEDERIKAIQGSVFLEEGVQGQAIKVDSSNHAVLGDIPGLIGNGRFTIAFWLRPHDSRDGPVLSNEAAGTGRNGVLIEFVDGRLRWNNNTRWISGVSTVETQHRFQPMQWVHVVLANDGTQRADGMLLYVNGRLQDVNVIRNTNSNAAGRDQGDAMKVGYSKHVGTWNGQVDELRFYTRRTLSTEEVSLLSIRETINSIASTPIELRSASQSQWMRIAYLEQAAPPEFAKLWDEWNEAIEKRTMYWDSLPTTMIMRDLAVPRPSFVRIRGVYNAFGEKVVQGVPAVLPPLDPAQSNNRLAMARWLVSRQHPLTARVTVNRIWQMFFGAGLVRTTEDFGSQGELPTHPELLDWLAVEFMENGWDMKALIKTIVMSHTYRQSSFVSPRAWQRDPENRLLARSPRLRLPGHVLRDQALFVSGLLVEKQGGPSVFPYQPDKLWEEASNAIYKVGKGEDLYRRSLYTYWKRTLAPPTMAVLDSADRESCSVKPKLTNTPLQALTLMNDVTFVEAAKKLGERLVREGGTTNEERINFAFRMVTARNPSSQEMAILSRALEKYREEYRLSPENAEATLRVGESKVQAEESAIDLAAVTALANVLLNLEEATTRE